MTLADGTKIFSNDYVRCMVDFGDGYGIERSSVSRHFQEASAKELAALAERRLDDGVQVTQGDVTADQEPPPDGWLAAFQRH